MIMIVWGSLTGLTAAVHSANQLYVARFLLGVAEAGFFPGVIVYLTHWFAYEDRAKAVANFMGALPISFVIGSPIAGALLGVHWLGIEGWRWLFILEGLPAVLLGIATLFLLTDRPREAQWLAAEQQQWITSRLDQERHAKSAVQSYTVWQALRYPPVLLLATSLLFAYIAFYSFVFWLPTMLKRMAAMSDLRVGVVGAIPYLAGFIGMQVIGWSSDHFRERRWHFVATQLLGAAALIVLLLAPMSVPTAVVCFTLVGVSVSAMLPCFWALPSAFLSDSAAAASIGFINAFASLGGFIGPEAIAHLHTRTGSFSAGLGFMAVSFVIAAVVVLFCPRERVG
jgi:MFS family permease